MFDWFIFQQGAIAFLIAFCDALAVVGIVVPALPLLFAVGALIGLGHVNGPYMIAAAAASGASTAQVPKPPKPATAMKMPAASVRATGGLSARTAAVEKAAGDA